VYTQCPECGTVFRVNAPVLRAAHGQVRCGVCGTAFDALRYLREGPQHEAGASPARVGREIPASRPQADDSESASPPDPPAPLDADEQVDLPEPAGLAALKARVAAFQAQMKVPAAVIPPATPAPRVRPEPPEPPDPEELLELLEDPRADDLDPEPRAEPGSEVIELSSEEVERIEFDADAMKLDLELEASGELEAPQTDHWQTDAATAQVWEGAPELRVEDDDGEQQPEHDDESDAAVLELEFEDLELVETDDEADLEEEGEVSGAVEEASRAFNRGANVEHVVIGGELADVPESALEFDLPAEEWDRVFVPDAEASTMPPLDPALASAQSQAMEQEPVPADEDEDEPQELAAEIDPDEDPLAITDQFPPLVVPPHELPPALADEPPAIAPAAAVPRPSRPPAPRPPAPPPAPPPALGGEDFDALVANAAARAAGELRGMPAARDRAPLAPGRPPVASPGANTPATSRPAAPASPPAVPPTASPTASATEAAKLRPTRPAPAPAEAPPIASEPEVAAADGELAPVGFDVTYLRSIAGDAASDRPWLRALLVALAALVLGIQLAHYWRESLAGDPRIGPPLVRLYRAFGVRLEPHWDVSAYTVKQWGGAAEAQPGMLRLQASIVNTAPKAQPYPLLRVTMLDRFGGKVARREFTPAEYLPGKHAPPGLLNPNARADADLALADPGQEAVGFELDVCLVQAVLRCAGERRDTR
jgi:predicted Zn finger-like uncharacterized protein